MCGVRKNTSCRQLFKDCKLLSHRYMYLKCYVSLKKYKLAVQKNEHIHDHNTRTNMNLYIKPSNTNLYKKSVINMGIRLHNKVPNNIKKLEEYKPYKREMKSFLIEHASFSLKEFFMS
jgi:hypothetical protein